MLVCLVAVAAMGLRAGDQSADLQYDSRSAGRVELPPVGPFAFWEQFRFAFDHSADEVFADRFHPLTVMNWNIRLAEGDSSRLREQPARVARNAFSKSLTYGLREAAVGSFMMSWLQENQGVLADFLWNTVDEVGEESVSPLDPSYRLAERSWWARLSQSERIRFGIRPLSESPYAFFGFNVRDGDQLYLLGHVRYYYKDLAEHKFELALSVPLARGLSLDLGTSYELGQNNGAQKLVMKLFKEFKSGGIMHVGFELQENPALFAGMSFPL